jgi:hypothetical protein
MHLNLKSAFSNASSESTQESGDRRFGHVTLLRPSGQVDFVIRHRHLGIAQPSLSEQIARLEQGPGAPLFERLHRRIELTPLGEAILGKAKALVEDALPDVFDQARAGVRGPLRVGSIPTILPLLSGAKAAGISGSVSRRGSACAGRQDGGTSGAGA